MLLLNFVTLILNLALQGLQVQAKITALEASKQTQMVIYESQAKIGMKEECVIGSFHVGCMLAREHSCTEGKEYSRGGEVSVLSSQRDIDILLIVRHHHVPPHSDYSQNGTLLFTLFFQ